MRLLFVANCVITKQYTSFIKHKGFFWISNELATFSYFTACFSAKKQNCKRTYPSRMELEQNVEGKREVDPLNPVMGDISLIISALSTHENVLFATCITISVCNSA
jgi:hypothetical protein